MPAFAPAPAPPIGGNPGKLILNVLLCYAEASKRVVSYMMIGCYSEGDAEGCSEVSSRTKKESGLGRARTSRCLAVLVA